MNPPFTDSLKLPSPNGRWWICSALLLATFLNYMDRQLLSVTLPHFKKLYQINEEQIGYIEGFFGFAFAIGSIVFGFLADRFGPRRLYPLVLLGWSAAGIATAWIGQNSITDFLAGSDEGAGVGPFRWLLLCRTLLGFFEAGHWPCALLTVQQILTSDDRPFGNSILQSGASLGAIIVPLYVELNEQLGLRWEFNFWSVGVLGIAWVPFWMILIRGHFPLSVGESRSEMTTAPSVSILRPFLALALVISCLNISWQFLRAWIALFLHDVRGFSNQSTRFTISAYFLATDVGCILAGILVRVLVARGTPIVVARNIGFGIFTALTALAAVVPFVESDGLMIVLLMLAGAGILGLHPYYYAFAQDFSAHRTGAISGFLAATGWVAASIFQIVIGTSIKNTQSYHTGLVIAGLIPLVALVSVLFLVRRPQ